MGSHKFEQVYRTIALLFYSETIGSQNSSPFLRFALDRARAAAGQRGDGGACAAGLPHRPSWWGSSPQNHSFLAESMVAE